MSRCIFPNIHFTYHIGENRSIYDVNNQMIINKMYGTLDSTYTLSIQSEHLELKSINETFPCDENGNIQFSMKRKSLKLNFVCIKGLETFTMRTLDTKLVMVIRKPSLVLIEYSSKFTVNLIISDRLSIRHLQSKNIDSIFTYKDPRKEMIDKSRKMERNKVVASVPVKHCEEESTEQGTVTTHFFFFDFIYFDDEYLKERLHSMENVKSLILLSGCICDCQLRGIINASTEDLKDQIKDCLLQVKEANAQVVIKIMSHGNVSGFYTRDGFVTEREFHNSLREILEDSDKKKILIHSYCQVYPDESNTTEGDMPPGGNVTSTVDSGILSSRVNETTSITSNEDKITAIPKSYINCLFEYAASVGQSSGLAENGSVLVDQCLKGVKYALEKDPSVNLVSILEKANEFVKFTTYITKEDNTIIKQTPWMTGSIDGGLWISTNNN